MPLELTRTETEYRSTDYDSIEEPRSDRPSGYTYPSRAGVCGIAAVTETVSYGSDGSITRSDESAEELVKPISEILFVGEGTGTEPGQPTGELLWPLETTDMYIGSLFREVREAFDARTGHHIGADLQTVAGDEVWAADGGTVILAEEHLSYGLLVEIDHGNGLVSLYGHLSDITVSVGDKVAPLDVVGHVGETGVATKSASALRAAARRCADKPVRVPTRYPRKLQRRKRSAPASSTQKNNTDDEGNAGIRGDTRPFEKGLAKTLIKGVFLGQSSGTIAR